MLSAARDALRADTSLGRDEEEVAAEGLAAVRGHVTAARLLTKHGLTTTARRAGALLCVEAAYLLPQLLWPRMAAWEKEAGGRPPGGCCMVPAWGCATHGRCFTSHAPPDPFPGHRCSTVRDADRAAALRLLRTLLARVSRTKNTESRWVEVWMDVRSIQEHGFGQVSALLVSVQARAAQVAQTAMVCCCACEGCSLGPAGYSTNFRAASESTPASVSI